MDQNAKLNRRQFLNKIAVTGAAVTGASIILSACKNDGGAGGQAAAPASTPKVDCSDVSALTDAEKKTREGLKYVDVTPDAAKNCANCKLFQKKAPCNGCTVVKGPIAENGWCSAWAPMG